MATRALLRDRPNRAIALVTPTHALILRHSTSSAPSTQASGISVTSPSSQNISVPAAGNERRCIVEFLPIEKADLSGYRVISNHNILGTLGLISIENDIFLCLVSGASRVATVRPGETVQQILSVDFREFLILKIHDFNYAEMLTEVNRLSQQSGLRQRAT